MKSFLSGCHPAAITVCLLVACIYLGTIYSYTVNIPYQDDVFDLLATFLDMHSESGLSAKFAIFYDPHNDHRTTSSRLVYWLALVSSGELNFNHLNLIANCLLLLFLSTFAWHSAQLCSHSGPAVVIFLMCLQPVTGISMLFTMGAFAFIGVIVYGYFSLALVSRQSLVAFTLAIAFAILATFALRSGQLIWPLGLAMLIYSGDGSRRIVRMCVWVGVASLCLLAYYWGFEAPGIDSLPIKQFPSLTKLFSFWLVLLGSGLSYGNTMAAGLIGLGTLVIFVYLCLFSPLRWTTMHLFCAYTLLSLTAVAYGRADFMPIELAALSPRYVYMSLLYLLTLLILLMADNRVFFHRIMLPLVLAAFCFNAVHVHQSLPRLIAHQNAKIEMYNTNSIWVLNSQRSAQRVVNESIAAGIFRPAEKPINKFDAF